MREASAAAFFAALALAAGGSIPPVLLIFEDAGPSGSDRDAMALLQRAATGSKASAASPAKLHARALVEQLLSQPGSQSQSAGASPLKLDLAELQKREDAQVRRQDAKLRSANAELRHELQEQAELLRSQEEQRRRQLELRERLLQPLPMTLMAAGVAFVLYWTNWLLHMLEFFARKQSIEKSNRKQMSHQREPVPAFEVFQKEIKESFLFGVSRLTARRILILIVIAVGGSSYLAQQGYFLAIRDKLVPRLYFLVVLILLANVALSIVWNQTKERFKTFTEAIEKVDKLGQALHILQTSSEEDES